MKYVIVLIATLHGQPDQVWTGGGWFDTFETCHVKALDINKTATYYAHQQHKTLSYHAECQLRDLL